MNSCFRFALVGFLTLCVLPLEVSAQQANDFDGARAFNYLREICAIGPRISGTPGMQQQQDLLEKHFTDLGGEVRYQEFDASHPRTGQPVRMRNIIVQWRPQATRRILLCCHYDTRPFPDRETSPALREKPFIGANDGGSGVALLMELGNHLGKEGVLPLNSDLGVDFVIFDGEELVYTQGDKYFLGSEYFATEYRDHPPQNFRYLSGVLLDMVAGTGATFYYEINSLRYAPEVTRDVWKVAADLGIRDFVARRKHEVLDDHLALNQIARIPTCDIIDFDYPHWHKRNDLPAACSAQTLGKVGRVMMGWIRLNANSTGK
ncbi:M28 family peptidase [Planctomicrobium sp. SH661]|uniref:M28 family peptidase n=1 Tax=Planctomicrobium sp. SH661 TaxID=3448124 RepID=UPI003F5B7BA1